MNILSLQFWIICVLFSVTIFGAVIWFKHVAINEISRSVAEVVRDQWAQMFAKLDAYKIEIEKIELEIKKLKDKDEWLQDKALLNRKDIEKILRAVNKKYDN